MGHVSRQARPSLKQTLKSIVIRAECLFEEIILLCSFPERGSVGIVGGNQTKTEGAQMEFQCRVVGWFPEPNVSWSVNGVAYSCNISSVTQGNLFNSSCTLTVTAVKNSSVQCLVKIPALSSPDISTVFLTVGKDIKHALSDQQIQKITNSNFYSKDKHKQNRNSKHSTTI